MKTLLQGKMIWKAAVSETVLFLICVVLIPACSSGNDSPEETDTTPPAEVSNVDGTQGNGHVVLTWTDPADEDFNLVEISYSEGGNPVQVRRGVQTATIRNLTNGTAYTFTLRTLDRNGNRSAGITTVSYTPDATGPDMPEPDPVTTPTVYMTTSITPESLMAIYQALGRTPAPGQRVAVKISTGENGSNYLRPALIGNFVRTLGGDIVECNTAYGGNRASTAMHYQLARDHGYNDIATVVIMDENSTMDIPVYNGTRLEVDRVGAHFADYQFHVVLSHFKGHSMAGYGGALKNMSIGYASSSGKSHIHSGGTSWSGLSGSQNAFLESMAEAAKSIVDYAGSENFIYINVMNRLSVDCDCDGHPAEPTMADVGILASLDPVALDKACLDIVENASDGADLRRRISSRNGTLTATHAAEIGLGSLEYELVSID